MKYILSIVVLAALCVGTAYGAPVNSELQKRLDAVQKRCDQYAAKVRKNKKTYRRQAKAERDVRLDEMQRQIDFNTAAAMSNAMRNK